MEQVGSTFILVIGQGREMKEINLEMTQLFFARGFDWRIVDVEIRKRKWSP